MKKKSTLLLNGKIGDGPLRIDTLISECNYSQVDEIKIQDFQTKSETFKG